MKKKSVISAIITLLILVIILSFLQRLLMPKYMTNIKEGALVAEYYNNAGGNDVIFIGDCEVYENISPITLWEEFGIPSYIRGSAQQLLWHSYYLLEETLKYEKPKVVVFSVLCMMYADNESTRDLDSREAYNRMTLDGMKWSTSKLKCIKASMTDDELAANGVWTYIFPILRYHDRWSDLAREDFEYLFKKEEVSDNGYLMQLGIRPVQDDYARKPLVDYTFGDTCYEYLDKIVDLCRENDIQLIFMKAPSLSPVWYDEWEAQIVDYAAEHDIYYVNFLNYQEEIGIDWNTDTYDMGLHLNVYGAEKLSRYLGQILIEECDLPDRRSDEKLSAVWEKKAETYNIRKGASD